MKAIITAAAILALSASTAWANPGNNGGGNGGCGNGQTTNGCGVQGGTGGQGGTGIGGSVLGSGNSSNSNRNTNLQAQGQQQGQQQNAVAVQGQSSRNDNRSSARNTNSNANSGNNSAQSVTVQGDHYEAARIPVATAYAAPLAASNGTCMGSSSVGGQGVGFGISIGSTWNDKSCDLRYDAEALRQAGQPLAAIARLCQKPEIASAMSAAGTPCPGQTPSKLASAAPTSGTSADASSTGYTGTDPIVRRRLGLPPLK